MKSLVLDKDQIEKKINRIAHQILEHNYQSEKLFIAGINGQGLKLAERISDILSKISDISIHVIPLDIDKEEPYSQDVSIPFDEKELENQTILIVDDVMNSGKTMMYGIKAFLSVKLRKISCVVLVDRTHKRFPIVPDFVGLSLATTLQEHIEVSLEKDDESVHLS